MIRRFPIWCVLAVMAGGATAAVEKTAVMRANRDPASGAIDIVEGGQPVLRYNYQTVQPAGFVENCTAGNRKYAQPRSNYIHPLELKYRLWIRRGDKPTDAEFGRQWQVYQDLAAKCPLTKPE